MIDVSISTYRTVHQFDSFLTDQTDNFSVVSHAAVRKVWIHPLCASTCFSPAHKVYTGECWDALYKRCWWRGLKPTLFRLFFPIVQAWNKQTASYMPFCWSPLLVRSHFIFKCRCINCYKCFFHCLFLYQFNILSHERGH